MDRNLLRNWKEALEGITGDVIALVESRYLFIRTMDVASSNPDLAQGGLFWDNVKSNYASAMVLGIARQVDNKREVESLLRFLMDLKTHHESITEDWYAAAYAGMPIMGEQFGRTTFRADFGTNGYLDEAIVQADIDSLLKITEKIEDFRHKRVAHKNKDKTLVFDIKFDDLSLAVDELERLVKKYQLLINQSGYVQLMPVIQYDWEKILHIPWIKD